MVLDKMVRTKWYRQNGAGKILRIVINQSRSYWQYDFFINPASTLMPVAFLYVLIIYL